MTCGVYTIYCEKLNKWYVGSSLDVESRWPTHRSDLNAGRHHSKRLQAAWNHLGPEAFQFELLVICEPGTRCELEQQHMNRLRSYSHGFNVHPNANRFGPMSEEMRQAMRDNAPVEVRKKNAKAQWADPEAKIRQVTSQPDFQTKRQAAAAEAAKRPALREMRRQQMLGNTHNSNWTPERRAAQAERARNQPRGPDGRLINKS